MSCPWVRLRAFQFLPLVAVVFIAACAARDAQVRGPAGRENTARFVGKHGVGALAWHAPLARPRALSDAPASTTTLPCNGHSALCDRGYGSVSYPATHNAHASIDDGFHSVFAATQKFAIAEQLADGVRALLLDVTRDRGVQAVCHGVCALGRTPHARVLSEILSFLQSHPREVLTLIYENTVTATELEDALIQSGLSEYVYARPEGASWPTLGEMIGAGTRLVVFSENGGGARGLVTNAWEDIQETSYGPHDVDSFSCERNRGEASAGLYLLNHWVNANLTDLPSAEKSIEANQYEVLLRRAQDCAAQSGRTPNFVAVDYYDRGDLFTVVDVLNGVL